MIGVERLFWGDLLKISFLDFGDDTVASAHALLELVSTSVMKREEVLQWPL